MNKLNVVEIGLRNGKGLSFTCGKLYVRITVDGLTLRVETNLPVRAKELAESETTPVRRSVFDRADELRRGGRHSDVDVAATGGRRVIRRRT